MFSTHLTLIEGRLKAAPTYGQFEGRLNAALYVRSNSRAAWRRPPRTVNRRDA